MRIGMFADMYTPHISGVTNYIRLYKSELERRGHDVYVFCFGGRDHEDDESNVVRSPGVPFGETGWQVPLALSPEARELTLTLDIAHAHHPFVSGYLALRQAWSAEIPVLFTNHTRYDIYSQTYAGWLPLEMRESTVRRYLSWFTGEVDLVLAPSSQIADWLVEWASAPRVEVLHNVIDVAAFADPASRIDPNELGLPPHSIVVVYSGRVAEEKNMSLLVEAFVRAASKNERLALLVVGDGPARQTNEAALSAAQLSDRVRFLGTVGFDEMPRALASGDVFATASVSETWPLVVMEAAAAGLPTVGVRSPGVGELVRDGETGLLVDEDAGELADAILALAEDGDLRGALGRGAREAAHEHDIAHGADRLLGIYERLIAEHGSAGENE